MAGKFRCTFEMEIDVQFENPQVAEDYFVRGEWRTCFYQLSDIKEVAEHLAYAFHQESDCWDSERHTHYRSVEGYGKYYRHADGSYKLDSAAVAEIGTMITVVYESELDNAGTYEI